MGIEPAFDDEGEELDYDVLVFDADVPAAYFRLKEEDITKVEKHPNGCFSLYFPVMKQNGS